MLGWVAAFIFLGYLLPHALVSLLPSQDLKKKARRLARVHARPVTRLTRDARVTRASLQYGASWALVTGASSGERHASPALRCEPQAWRAPR